MNPSKIGNVWIGCGEAPFVVIQKPVPKISEDRLSKQLETAIGEGDGSRTQWLLAAALQRFPAGKWRDVKLGEELQFQVGPVGATEHA